MGLPSQSLPTLLVKLLTHRCTIACDFSIHRQSAALSFSRLCNHRLLRSFRSRFSHNGGHIMLVPHLLKHSFLWHYPPTHAARSFSGCLFLDARTFLTCKTQARLSDCFLLYCQFSIIISG